MHITSDQIRAVLIGVATADALGVPVEFRSREYLETHPVTYMMGYGTYNLPPGTWSDDSSLTFCLAEALLLDFDPHIIAQLFTSWYRHNYWTPRGSVFDIGIATRQAINRILDGCDPLQAGGKTEDSNGNGSLMRIAPLVFLTHELPVGDRFEYARKVSSLTHGHIRSVIGCFYYLEFMRYLLIGKTKEEAYSLTASLVTDTLHKLMIPGSEVEEYNSLLKYNVANLTKVHVHSSGYVVHTLEAAIWCVMTTGSYRDAVLKAVNLGEDTDTVAAVTGGLAGLLYGIHTIPENWVRSLARIEDIFDLCDRFGEIYAKHA